MGEGGGDSEGRLGSGQRGFVIVFPPPSTVRAQAEERNDARCHLLPYAIWKLEGGKTRDEWNRGGIGGLGGGWEGGQGGR